MKRWLKRLGMAGVVLAGLCTVFLAVEHIRGRRMLSRCLVALESKGEILAIAALKPERPLPKENAFLAVVALFSALDTVTTNAALPPTMRLAAPGRAVVTARLKEWSYGEDGPSGWTQVEHYLEGMEQTLAALRSAAGLPSYDCGFDYDKGFVDFQLAQVVYLKNAVGLLSVATLCDLHQGDLAEAHANLLALVKLAVNQKSEPLIILQLVRQACMAIAFNTTWQALQASGWTEEQLAVLQTAWSGCDLPGDMGRAFEMERAMTLDFYRQCKDSYAALRRAVGEREETPWAEIVRSLPTRGFWLHWVHLPVYRVAWMDQDAARDLERWQLVIERERVARENSWSALANESADGDSTESLMELTLSQGRDGQGWYDRLRYLFSSEPMSISDVVYSRTLLLQSQQQMLLTAIAVKRYRAKHGAEPPDLNALVPDLLAALPKDWMDGRSLRYRVQSDGGFLLYSVGEDGEDDGGDPSPDQPDRTYRQLRNGKDAVWPSAATDEQAETAMNSEP